MTSPFASVLIPTRNPGTQIRQVLCAVFDQHVEFEFEVIIVDSSSVGSDTELMRAFPVQLQSIPQSEFGHGRTRNFLGALARGEVLLYLSQDAEPSSRHWMQTLAEPLADPKVAGSYARQVPRPDADPLIRFFLAHTYGGQPARRSIKSGVAVSIDEIFFSNVSSAVRREVWQRFPFRADIVMSEDQYWAYDVLNAGYDIVYHPAAQVLHSHNYSLRTLFRRNWNSGASLRGLIADTPLNIVRHGMTYIAGQTAYLVRDGRVHWLPYMFVYEATKALAFGMGMRFGHQRV